MRRTVALVLLLVLGRTAEVANAGFVLGTATMDSWGGGAYPFWGAGPSISADGLTLFFYADFAGTGLEGLFPGYGGGDLYVATRPTKSADWGQPTNVGAAVSSSAYERDPDISADGLTLYFCSDREGGSGGLDLWATTRPTTVANWTEPVNLGPTISSSVSDGDPSISADGRNLYFCSYRSGDGDLYVTTRPAKDANWTEPVNLGSPVNSSDDERSPCICGEGRTLFFHSTRPGGSGNWDLWVTTRPTTDSNWAEPVNLGSSVNTSWVDADPTISADGSALYFCSHRGDGWGIYEAPITFTIDFDGDNIVDFGDFCILGDFWGREDSLADISPPPVGDGMVDGQDMAVFAEYWLFRTPDSATNPSPADGSGVAPLISDSNVYVVLDYAPGRHAIKHTGYFGDNIDDVNNRIEDANLGTPPWPATSATAFYVGYDHTDIPEFARAPLVRGKTYYWCVDEFDGLFTWPGPVWSFVVMPIEAWGPDPIDGETNVPTDQDLTLSWNLGCLEMEGYLVRYIVYFGTDQDAMTELETVEPTSHDVSGLVPSTAYYWRIDTRRTLISPPFTSIITPGNIWSFTTSDAYPPCKGC